MVTEDEARQKWCPMVRVQVHSVKGSINRDFYDDPHLSTTCVASACMMWREGPTMVKPVRGYCGLAGADK